MFEANPIPARDSEGSNKPCAHQDPEIPQRLNQTVFECLLRRYRSAVYCCRNRGSERSRPRYRISLLRGGRHRPHYRATKTWTGLLEDTNKILCATGFGRKEQWPHKRLTQTCSWVSRSLKWKLGSAMACCRAGGSEGSSAWMGPAEGGHHCLHYLHHSSAPGQAAGREHSPAHQQKIKDLLTMFPPTRKRPSFHLSQSLPSGSFHETLILLHQKADKKKNTVKGN